MTETERSLLDAVIADPHDDLPRRVMADWYDENGDPDRAGFIRSQLDLNRDMAFPRQMLKQWFPNIGAVEPYLIARGWPRSVKATFSDLLGGELCQRCRPRRMGHFPSRHSCGSCAVKCMACGGSGRIERRIMSFPISLPDFLINDPDVGRIKLPSTTREDCSACRGSGFISGLVEPRIREVFSTWPIDHIEIEGTPNSAHRELYGAVYNPGSSTWCYNGFTVATRMELTKSLKGGDGRKAISDRLVRHGRSLLELKPL